MKAYLATTALIFIALVVAHVMRMFVEPFVARDPWFLITTFVSLTLASWAVLLYRQTSRRQSS